MKLVENKENFIFDLYGTLLDIRTDEVNQHLWGWLASVYNDVGLDYEASEVRKKYHSLVKEKEEALSRELHTEYPEIELRDVFRDILQGHVPKEEKAEKWVENIAFYFRLRSRLHFQVYPDSVPTLQKLREMGKRIYLLSNAQNCFTMSELEKSGLLNYFDEIYISSDYRVKKPAPEFMGKLLEEQRLNPEKTVMIGNDYSSDVASAGNYDMDSVFLNTDRYSKSERAKRLKKVKTKMNREITPYVIESGKLLEIFDL